MKRRYERWSLGYALLKKYIWFADWLIHKKTVVTGKEKIPNNKPLVFAPNHQNALSDPMAVLQNTRFQPVWLARADIFGKSKMTDALLRFMKIMPVYRLRDGKENLVKNEQTFSDSIKVLENNFALGLFPEAAHSAKRQSLPHKKAVPRIVFMAWEQSRKDLDIHIIPTGIYYSHYWKFNRNIIVNFGTPIRVKDFHELYHKNAGAAIIALKNKLFESVIPLTLNIRSREHYEDFERIRELYGKHFLERQHKEYSLLNLFRSDQKLAGNLDRLEEEKPKETQKLVYLMNQYVSVLKRNKLRNWLLEEQNHLLKIIRNLTLLLLGVPVFLYGFVFNALPFFIIDWLVGKKVKDPSFRSTFYLGAGILLFPLFYLLELLPIALLFPGFWLNVLFLISFPFAGKWAFRWFILLRKTIGLCRIITLKHLHKATYRGLAKQKAALFERLDEFIPVTP